MSDHVTRLLEALRPSDAESVEALYNAVYDELCAIANKAFGRERVNHTLQPTALVHEAYMRLVDQKGGYQNRSQFFAVAGEFVRRVLVDHARAKARLKRGGDYERVPITIMAAEKELDLLALNEALDDLRREDERLAKLVDMRFFAGLTLTEAASALDMSERAAYRHWSYAKSRLHEALYDGE